MLFSVGLDWPLSERFPRVTLCDFQILQLDNVQKYTVQCVCVCGVRARLRARSVCLSVCLSVCVLSTWSEMTALTSTQSVGGVGFSTRSNVCCRSTCSMRRSSCSSGSGWSSSPSPRSSICCIGPPNSQSCPSRSDVYFTSRVFGVPPPISFSVVNITGCAVAPALC